MCAVSEREPRHPLLCGGGGGEGGGEEERRSAACVTHLDNEACIANAALICPILIELAQHLGHRLAARLRIWEYKERAGESEEGVGVVGRCGAARVRVS